MKNNLIFLAKQPRVRCQANRARSNWSATCVSLSTGIVRRWRSPRSSSATTTHKSRSSTAFSRFLVSSPPHPRAILHPQQKLTTTTKKQRLSTECIVPLGQRGVCRAVPRPGLLHPSLFGPQQHARTVHQEREPRVLRHRHSPRHSRPFYSLFCYFLKSIKKDVKKRYSYCLRFV